MKVIGRTDEKKTFEHCLNRTESKLLALYDRRRVGKTFLVRQYFGKKIRFKVAGLYTLNKIVERVQARGIDDLIDDLIDEGPDFEIEV